MKKKIKISQASLNNSSSIFLFNLKRKKFTKINWFLSQLIKLMFLEEKKYQQI